MIAPTASPRPPLTAMEKIRMGAFWLTTLIVALEMAAGSVWDLERIPFVTAVFDHLGYPHYLLTILGPWKLLGAITVLAPGLSRLKEWAYAGIVFNYTGAAASHALAGDGPSQWAGPLVFSGIALVSWALLPGSRRQEAPNPREPLELRRWGVAIGVTVLMLIFALLTLPKDVPKF